MQVLRDHKSSLLEAESQTPSERGFEDVESLTCDASVSRLSREGLLAFEAMRLLIHLDSELLEARTQWNQDWFRRIMRIRRRAASRLRRRWANLNPTPAVRLGNLRRRYHANLAGYLYQRK